MFKKGVSGNPTGRPKGTLDKINKIKNAILNAFDPKEFAKWKREEPTEFYKLMTKVMPNELLLKSEDNGATGFIIMRANYVEPEKKAAPAKTEPATAKGKK